MRVWQVWNEPHLNLWWNTDGRSPNAWAREYAALLKTAKAAIDAADPGATVVLAALADYAWKHLTRLNQFKIGRYYDVAAINLFTARPASVIRGVRYFRRAMRRGGAGRKPVWLTEATWPAGKGRVSRPQASWQRAWYTTDQGMADRVGDIYKLAVKYRRKLRIGQGGLVHVVVGLRGQQRPVRLLRPGPLLGRGVRAAAGARRLRRERAPLRGLPEERLGRLRLAG